MNHSHQDDIYVSRLRLVLTMIITYVVGWSVHLLYPQLIWCNKQTSIHTLDMYCAS